MKKLLIFDKFSKKIISRHEMWEDNYTISDNWKSFNPAKEVALILEKNYPEMKNGKVLQPASYEAEVSEPIYVDPKDVRPEPEPKPELE